MPTDATHRSPPPPTTSPPASDSRERTRVVRSDALFDGAEVLVVQHRGQSYHLRQTRLGKLILTK